MVTPASPLAKAYGKLASQQLQEALRSCAMRRYTRTHRWADWHEDPNWALPGEHAEMMDDEKVCLRDLKIARELLGLQLAMSVSNQ